MAVPQAMENKVLDQLRAVLLTIGVNPTQWLVTTNGPGAPEVIEGIIADALPAPNVPRLYYQVVRTEAKDEASTGSRHHARVRAQVWMTAATARGLHDIKADVMRAIWAQEAAVAAALDQPFWVESWTYRDDMNNAGLFNGFLSLFVDVDLLHSAP